MNDPESRRDYDLIIAGLRGIKSAEAALDRLMKKAGALVDSNNKLTQELSAACNKIQSINRSHRRSNPEIIQLDTEHFLSTGEKIPHK